MSWATRFRIRETVRGSLWVIPLLGGLLGGILGTAGLWLDRNVEAPTFWQYSPSTASTVLSAIVGAMAALTGFVVTVTALVVQMATGTLSARYMRLWYRDRLLKLSLALLIGTLTFSFAMLRRIESDFVPNLGVTVAGFLVFVSLLVFVLFLDRYLHRLRPVAVAALVSRAGRRALEDLVRAAKAPDTPKLLPSGFVAGPEPSLRVRADRAGSIQAVNGQGLVRWARRHECLLVLPHAVGDFLPEGAVLVEIHGGVSDAAAAAGELRGLVALGDERTIQQDPAFAIRIMVDIAARALSPAVNDPTTAVQMLDHLGDSLRLVGTTDFGVAEGEAAPGSVLVRARRWEDFLALAVTEIREYGARSIQVSRRLRALLEELGEEVRPEHRQAVEDELARLEQSVAAAFAGSPDLDRAGMPDRQGIGGPGALRQPEQGEVR